MLSIYDQSRRLGRREFLRIGALTGGALGLGGLSLPDLARAGATGLGSVVKDKAVVLLHMQGGPSQFETFDPKPEAPVELRNVTGEIATRLPGVQFASGYSKLADVADRLTVVRSFVPGDASHDIKPVVSSATGKASLGAIYGRVAGTTTAVGLPRSTHLTPSALSTTKEKVGDKFGRFSDPGTLGAQYAPFVPGSGGPMQEAMRSWLPRTRLDDRRTLLSSLDGIRRSIDASGSLSGMDRFQEQAFEVILNGAADAFDLSAEDPRTVARYDTAPLLKPEQIDPKWKNFGEYCNHAASLGKLMLLARRLVERGVGFVTISTGFVWDNHADVNNCGVAEGSRYCGIPFDHAVSTFIKDLEERGLSDKVLLVCVGEIGRTPRINARGGRDHWGNLGPLLMAGGGMPRGRVIGTSTRDGGEAADNAVTQRNLVGTILHTVFDVGRLRLIPGMSTDLLRVAEAEPIGGLA
jgi:hypothetical protein